VLEHDPALGGVRKPRPPSAPTEASARRRRAGFLAGVGVLLLGAAVGAFLLLGRGDTGPVVVPSNAVAVVDPTSDEVVEAVRVGDSPGPIALGGDSGWVVNENDGTISVIDLETRVVVHTNTFKAGNFPSIAVRDDGGAVWLATASSGELEPWGTPARSRLRP
jgi:DNA-binding beta-propeller fold protein YncE